MKRHELTHIVAVIGYVYRSGRFLLLKRRHPPLLWAPPGGRLHPHEPPRTGLKREIAEETGLEVEVLTPADIWFGDIYPGTAMLSIDFLVRITGGHLKLSEEHSDYRWVSATELNHRHPIDLGHSAVGFKPDDFERAERLLHQQYPDRSFR